MRQVFLVMSGENPILIKTLITFSKAELDSHFLWEIPLAEDSITLYCFYPAIPTERMLEKLTESAIRYVRDED